MALAKRASATLALKGNDVPWPAWFRRLAHRASARDTYEVAETTNTDLAAVLTEYRKHWNTSS